MRPILFSLLFVVAGLFQGLQAQADVVNSFFQKYSEHEQVTSIFISPRFFSMFKQMDLNLEDKESEAISEMVEDLTSLRILVAEEGTLDLYTEFTDAFKKADYELLMRINNKGEDEVDFLIKEEADKINELIMLIGGKSADFVLLSFTGNIDLEKVNKLSESFENSNK